MYKHLLSWVIAWAIVTTAQAQYCTTNPRFSEVPFFTDDQITTQSNIPYATVTNWQGASEVLRLDAYFPKLSADTMTKRPLILMIHGGGLVSGDKINFTRVCREFARRGFVALSIDYRLGLNCLADITSKEKAAYRAQQDANAAFRFVVENANVLRIDTAWMFIGGGSAGAVTALSLVYLSQSEWNAYAPAIPALLGNLNNSGNNLTHSYTIKGIFNNWGAMLAEFIQPHEMRPMVSFHGDNDATVAVDSALGGGCLENQPSYGSRTLHKILVENGVCSDLSVKPGGEHGVYEDSVGTAFRVGRAACFFKSLFCNSCVSFYQTDSVPAHCSQISSATLTPPTNAPALVVSPNPFTHRITLQNATGLLRYRLYHPLGQLLDEGSNPDQRDFSHLSPGIYLLVVETTHGAKTFKLVKSEE